MQVKALDDGWHWTDAAEGSFGDVRRDRAIRLPARRDDVFTKAKRKTGGGQGSLDL